MLRLTLPTLLALVLAPLASAQSGDWQELAKQIAAASDGYEVADASQAFAKVRDPAAMEARVELFDDKLEIRGGVHLRDWLFTGMLGAESLEESEVLLAAAASKKSSPLLRLVCLRSLRRGGAIVRIDSLLDRDFERLQGELRRAWQNAAGKLLADARVDFTKSKRDAASLRAALLDHGMPFLGFRWLAPTPAELLHFRSAWQEADDPSDRAQFLHVLAVQANSSPAALALYLDLLAPASRAAPNAERVAVWASAVPAQVWEAAPVLIAGLNFAEHEPASRHSEDYATALRALTGQQFGRDADRWQTWWTRDGEAWVRSARSGEGSALRPAKRFEAAEETVAQYLGIPIDSARVGFVLDGSGSMNDPLDDGRRSADAAADEFEAFLERYPENAVFHLRVIVRTSQSPFKSTVKATKRNRAKATSYVRRFDFGPASAMYDVLLEAQSDPQLDTLVFVSDGGGSWGSFAYPGHMLDGLRLAYERSGVRIHTICVGKSRNKARFMTELAEITSGRMERF
jgi:hypothetical protein